jgi:predicted permease
VATENALPVLVMDIVRRGQERGEFSRRIDPRLAAASFFATAGAIISGQVFAAGDLSPEEVNRQFLQVVFSGLSTAGDAP